MMTGLNTIEVSRLISERIFSTRRTSPALIYGNSTPLGQGNLRFGI